MPDRSASSMPVLLGAAMIAAAILLSTLVTAVSTRFIGMDSPNDDNVWLIDRLTGNVYKCQAADRGKASCEPDVATGSIGQPPKRGSGFRAAPDRRARLKCEIPSPPAIDRLAGLQGRSPCLAGRSSSKGSCRRVGWATRLSRPANPARLPRDAPRR